MRSVTSSKKQCLFLKALSSSEKQATFETPAWRFRKNKAVWRDLAIGGEENSPLS
jgi:hypothetical protein